MCIDRIILVDDSTIVSMESGNKAHILVTRINLGLMDRIKLMWNILISASHEIEVVAGNKSINEMKRFFEDHETRLYFLKRRNGEAEREKIKGFINKGLKKSCPE